MGNGSSKSSAGGLQRAPSNRRLSRRSNGPSRSVSFRGLGGGAPSAPLAVRYSLRELEDMYYLQNRKEPLEKLVRAWKKVQEDPKHNLKGVVFPTGNVLFPTWHRAFLVKLEEALQSVEPGVRLPYWDETSEESRKLGIPRTLTDETFELDGEVIPNPLRSKVLKTMIKENGAPALDETVDSTDEDSDTSNEPQSLSAGVSSGPVSDAAKAVELLNKNVTAWLNGFPGASEASKEDGNIVTQYKNCLNAPTYTLFSNSTSADAYNEQKHDDHIVSLESAGSGMHLCVWAEDDNDHSDHDLDPLWVMHLTFLDYVFWMWQLKNGRTRSLDIDPKDDGAVASPETYMNASKRSLKRGLSTKGLNPTLSLTSPLQPLQNSRRLNKLYTSKDVIDIERQLGYTYSKGSLQEEMMQDSLASSSIRVPTCTKKLVVSGVSSLAPQEASSYLVEAFAEWKGPKGVTRERLGYESIVCGATTSAGVSMRQLSTSASGKSTISIPLAVGLDPLEYARSVTVNVQLKGSPARSYPVQVELSEDNRNIYHAFVSAQ